MKLFSPNIEFRGRVIRALIGVVFAIVAALIYPHSRLAAGACVVAAAFLFFEGARGWCAARACGLRTPL